MGGVSRAGGGGLPTGGQGSKVYVLCAEPKEHKHFRPGTRPGGFGHPAGRSGDRDDREIVYVPHVYVPFPAPIFWGFPCFFLFRFSLLFLCLFAFFSKDLKVSAKRKPLFFFGVSVSFFFNKNQGWRVREGSGFQSIWLRQRGNR